MTVASPAAEAAATTRRGEVRRGSRAGRRRSAHPARRRRRSAPAPTTRRRSPQAAGHHRPATPRPTGSTPGRIVVVTKHRWVRAVIRKEWPVPPAESEAETDRDVRRVRVVGTSDALEALERRAPGDDLPARVHLPVERERHPGSSADRTARVARSRGRTRAPAPAARRTPDRRRRRYSGTMDRPAGGRHRSAPASGRRRSRHRGCGSTPRAARAAARSAHPDRGRCR